MKYRVFLSYSHEDRPMVEEIAAILAENGLAPMWDRNFKPGWGFHDQIRNFIAHSHVFVPFITEVSSRRGWVHQEIGFATALNIPVLPITLDRVPGELLQQHHAVPFSSDSEELKSRLSFRVFEKLVTEAQERERPLFYCAEFREDRTRMMVDYARSVLHLEEFGKVRQKGGLSSFHIPDRSVHHRDWQERFGTFWDERRCLMLREERRALERHARAAGCRLIIDPHLNYGKYGPQSKSARLRTLIEFLESMPDDRLQVAVMNNPKDAQHLTIVGDWFAAEAVSASMEKGIRQTIFTRHAPSVRRRIELFDEELECLLQEQGIAPEASRESAVLVLRGLELG